LLIKDWQDLNHAMANTLLKTGYAPVNGLKMYYEIHGSGDPMMLLHGAFGTTGMFGTGNKRKLSIHGAMAAA